MGDDAAVAAVLQWVATSGAVVAGHAAVTNWNPHGAPMKIKSLALAAPPEETKEDVGDALVALLGPGTTVKPAGALTVVSRNGVTVATVFDEVFPPQCVVNAVVRHDGITWTVPQFTPEYLRLVLCARHSTLVSLLDAFMAERLLEEARKAPPAPPLLPAPMLPSPWPTADAWAHALLAMQYYTAPALGPQPAVPINDLDLHAAFVHAKAAIKSGAASSPLHAFMSVPNPAALAAFLMLPYLGPPWMFLGPRK